MICTPAQLPKFDSLFGKMLNKRGGDGKKKNPGSNWEKKLQWVYIFLSSN